LAYQASHLSICLFISLSVGLSAFPPVYLPVCQPYLLAYQPSPLSTFLSVSLFSVGLSAFSPVFMPVYQLICWPISLLDCLPASLSAYLLAYQPSLLSTCLSISLSLGLSAFSIVFLPV
jgi:hypothetical protein